MLKRLLYSVLGKCDHQLSFPMTDLSTGKTWQTCVRCGEKFKPRVDLSPSRKFRRKSKIEDLVSGLFDDPKQRREEQINHEIAKSTYASPWTDELE